MTREQRPSEAVFSDCARPRLCHETLTDDLLDRICLHWENTRIFRTLYLDASFAAEYEAFREKIAEHDDAAPAPAFTTLSINWRQVDSNMGPDHAFKERFHRALCLNTIATLVHTLGKASSPYTVEGFEKVALLTWTKGHIVLAGTKISLTPEEMVGCMEVHDFLYLFMLPKLLPLEKVLKYAEESSGGWAAIGYSVGLDDEEDLECWSSVLYSCRLCFQPLDLVALFASQSWRSHLSGSPVRYPPSLELYMLERGCYDVGADIRDYWRVDEWDRRLILDKLHWVILSDGIDLSYYGDGADQPRWWDRIRARSGSPFQPDFSFKAWLVCQGMRPLGPRTLP